MLVLSTATTPACCLSSPPLRLVLVVDAEVMLIFPLLFHKWSKSNKENERTKYHFWQIWEMVGRWKRCQKKWDQVGVHGERHGDVPCMLSRALLGKAGALLGHHTQVPSKPQWGDATWSISPGLLQALFRLYKEGTFHPCHYFSFYLFSVLILITFLILTLLYSFSHLLNVHAAAAKSLQSCPTLSDPMGCSPLGSSVHRIFQARVLEWVAISFSNVWKWKVKVKSLSHVRLLATPWTAAHQVPPSMGFSRQEHWSGVPSPSP